MNSVHPPGSFKSLLICNLKLQHRQGFTAAWAVISLFYILGLSFIPGNIKTVIIPLVLLSEPSTFAMIFTGAILLLERDERLLENLFITPMSIRAYMVSKALALSLPAAVSTTVITLVLRGPSLSLLIIPPAVILTTLVFGLYTFIPASASRDIMGLLGRIGLYGSPFALSILDYFGVFPGVHHYLLPSKGSLELMQAAAGTGETDGLTMILSLASICLWIVLIIPAAEKQFRKNLIHTGAIA
ncbi:MAG: hypothetical protein PQJ58_21075 [Spirochaetales bacterium]|nr:hypothetical protein [Spirochaetales bacterium]